ncbi:hypothetical protein [Mycolicibacter icosiumassiliensis]|uniref:hypothetical protein n=1 Tax=Mycolicibacter icosiumassiliensis TaxID=1792835 RepID=UPI0012B68FB1|nr:hypothetical protein [Mycolicibacter icosiumassiliensis]
MTISVSAAGGFAAAIFGMGTALADGSDVTDLDLISSASANAIEAFSIISKTSGDAPLDTSRYASDFTQLEGIERPLLTSDNETFSGLGHLLFDGPDQQLSQTSEAFLSAAQEYAADPSLSNELAAATTSFQMDGAVLFDALPSLVVGKIVDQIFDLGGFDAGNAGADLASAFDLPF